MSEENEALRDMLSDARLQLEMVREKLGVEVEPHQTLTERMLEAAGEFEDLRNRMATICELLDEGFDEDAPDGHLYDTQAVNQAHRVAAGGMVPRETKLHQWECTSLGMYDFTYKCTRCGEVFVESIDSGEECPAGPCPAA